MFTEAEIKSESRQSLKCVKCGLWLKLSYASFEVDVEGVAVEARDMPVLVCPNCGQHEVPDRSKGAILHHVAESRVQQKNRVLVWRKPEHGSRRFKFCPDVNFLYDATDHDYLPGLKRPWDEGFLTPVFFNKAVLVKYMNHPSYVVELGSDSYGSIYKDREPIAAFGVNRSGLVIIWLGDLDRMELAEQHYLRSENVPTDHDIGSDFYLGQIEAVFTDYSKERRLFRLRLEFAGKAAQEFGVKVNQYEPEVIEVMAEVVRPVTWSEKEVRGVIEALNKVLVESLNNDDLRKGILKLDPGAKCDGMKGLKSLQRWLTLAYGLDAPTLMRPFFVLYDFRIVAAHLISAESSEKMLASCHERMGIPEATRNFETLYDALIDDLIHTYKQLLVAIPNGQSSNP